MIKGAIKWNDRSAYYIQTNNPTEALLRAKEDSGWLESCGPTAAVNCLAARGENIEILCPGKYKPQPEEVLMDYLNDPRNKTELDRVRKVRGIPGNRVPQFYPLAIKSVFGCTSVFTWGLNFRAVADRVVMGKPVQICLIYPGHYVAVVAYDEVEDMLIYNDSWPDRFVDKNGFNREISTRDFATNVQNYFIVYG